MNQSELEVNPCNRHKARENAWEKVTIGLILVPIGYVLMQESWNFKPFTGGKQNPKSPRSPKNSDESENIKSGGAESEADNKVKNPSKHQQKAARKADRVGYEYCRGDLLCK